VAVEEEEEEEDEGVGKRMPETGGRRRKGTGGVSITVLTERATYSHLAATKTWTDASSQVSCFQRRQERCPRGSARSILCTIPWQAALRRLCASPLVRARMMDEDAHSRGPAEGGH